MSLPHYLCPICRSALNSQAAGFHCSNNHHFDRAKEGYVNLLPVQHKHSKDPGDNKAMVLARRAFLEQGYYQPLIDKLTSLYQAHGDTNLPVLDAGCGEGYYTHQHKTDNNSVYGVDIAKNAVKIAAKRYKSCHFSVGTLSHLPFEDEFFGWLFSIYAPILEPEFTRVLKSGAYLLTVTPAEDHLFELKSLIYREPQKHDTGKSQIKALRLVHEEKLNYQMDFNGPDDVINLLAMTPFAFKTSEALLEQINAMTIFSCQADFHIRLYQKT
ncbi:23S rRNA (guanine(745)-N(1))-methyltransferase [Thalassomonas actiniarum]|uniref:23S rRNA (Guanine(745)-N(1))-methyltransferase n=1 Tax=Thalassomonas actiniarum TaxID=485447 RepID=A0AAE9YP53_9GAMM|nr:23S rRNA (guanine(745)-N(1))-methyltransferase [Thalassomonas actiniarum]WDD96971.1 23S rRNA (guanine(745)-N(1))-methyltransferase [Thalassomonas actiniarum]